MPSDQRFLPRGGARLSRSHAEQHWRDVRDQGANVESGRDTLIVSIELKRRRAVHECPEPDGDLLGVGGVAVLPAIGRHLVDHVLQTLFATLVDLLDLPQARTCGRT